MKQHHNPIFVSDLHGANSMNVNGCTGLYTCDMECDIASVRLKGKEQHVEISNS